MTMRNRSTALALALALGGLTVVLDTTVSVVAVPALVRAFGASLASVQWVTTAYVLALVTTMPLSAWLGGRFQHRRAYAAALVVFAAGSAWAGAAHGIGELIAARVLQGLGGGLVNPLGMTLGLRDVPVERRGRVAALLGLPVLVGPSLGPVLAGSLIDSVSWRAVFAITIAPALAGAVLVLRMTRHDAPLAVPPTRPDIGGSTLLVPGAVAVVFAVAQNGTGWAPRTALAAAGVCLLTAFARRSMRHPAPLLRTALLARPDFRSPIVVLTLFAAAYFGAMMLTPTYVQITRGSSALVSGSLGIPVGLATGVSLQVATRLVDRVPAGRVVCAGLAIALAANISGIAVLRADTPFWVLGVLGAVLGIGSGAVLMPSMTAATRALRGDLLASGSAILALGQQLASAVGTAGITAVFGGLVAWHVPVPGGLPGVSRLPGAARAPIIPDLVDAQRLTQVVPLILIVLALAVAVRRLPLTSSATGDHATAPHSIRETAS